MLRYIDLLLHLVSATPFTISTSMSKQLPLVLQPIESSLDTVVAVRYSNTATYVVCFYDWIISLDQEVDLIYPSA
ncbi:hypothetical protein EI94DRAFT_1742520 [Lactarius quietus]|nr:hypothetical protein EI94DRAFT_1742520 [Lactarius quietus]